MVGSDVDIGIGNLGGESIVLNYPGSRRGLSMMHQFWQATNQLSSLSLALGHRLGQSAAALALVAPSLTGLAIATPQVSAAEDIQITY